MEKEYENFIERLNNLFEKNCTISFNQHVEHFCYKSGNININTEIVNSPELVFFKEKLGNDYWKYVVLHEYGHFLCNEKIKDGFQQNKDLIIDCYLFKLFEKIKLNDGLSNLYTDIQYYSACELFADYFIYGYIEKFKEENLDFNKFLNWRKSIVLKDFNSIYNKGEKFLLLSALHYFHIPLSFKEILNGDSDLEEMILISIKNCELITNLAFKIDVSKSDEDKNRYKEMMLKILS